MKTFLSIRFASCMCPLTDHLFGNTYQILLLAYYYICFLFISISLHNVQTSFINKPTVNARHKALIMLTGIYSLLEMELGWIWHAFKKKFYKLIIINIIA